jgi:hypothetical protein
MSTKLECYICSKEFELADSIRFIKFDHETKMTHDYCYAKIEEYIEQLRHEAKDIKN